MRTLSSRRVAVVASAVSVVLFLLAFCCRVISKKFDPSVDLGLIGSVSFSSRKLLEQGAGEGDGGNVRKERIGDGCSKDDIVLYQAETAPLPSGIPTYTVEVHNLCSSGGCMAFSDIHFSCGWFSSARLINPRVFRRVRYDDCIVNDGRPLSAGASISFQYANSFRYPLYVVSAVCSP